MNNQPESRNGKATPFDRHPRADGDSRDEIELFLRDAYAAGCYAAMNRSLLTAAEYAEQEAPRLRSIVSETEATIANHAEVIGNVTAALLDLNVTYDGNRATFTFESTSNAMSYIHKARAIVEERLALIRSYRQGEAK